MFVVVKTVIVSVEGHELFGFLQSLYVFFSPPVAEVKFCFKG